MPTRDIKLRYGDGFRTLSINEQNLLGVVEPKKVPAGNLEKIISEALDNPLGTPALGEMVEPGGRIAVLIDDNTRPTPCHLLLPPLLDRLRTAGIDKENITILVAGGTHRPMLCFRIRPHKSVSSGAIPRMAAPTPMDV